jgi:hypothetical protein
MGRMAPLFRRGSSREANNIDNSKRALESNDAREVQPMNADGAEEG